MPPKGSSKERQTRSKARACNTLEVTPATSQALDPEEIIDLETSTGVPRLTRFLVARFHFTRIFEAAQKDFRNTDL